MITSILLGLALGAALITAGRLYVRNQLLAAERDQLVTDCNQITMQNITLIADRERAVARTREFVNAHVDLLVDQCARAADLDAAYARIGELTDQNQLLLDDAADNPIPFTIVKGGGDVVPMQRAAGDQS